MIVANCGHSVDDYDELQTVRLSGEDCDAVEGFVPCVSYREFCRPCAERAASWPEFLPDEAAVDAWLEAQR
jgi:hypothetical protein